MVNLNYVFIVPSNCGGNTCGDNEMCENQRCVCKPGFYRGSGGQCAGNMFLSKSENISISDIFDRSSAK